MTNDAFEKMNTMSKDLVENSMKTAASMGKNFQAIAAEGVEYTRKTAEKNAEYAEKLMGVRSIEQVMEINTAFFKDSYEGFVSETQKMGELYSSMAQELYAPVEGAMNSARG